MRWRSVSFATALGVLNIVVGLPSMAGSSQAPPTTARAPVTLRPAASSSKDPDHAGFIQRWVLLEPIRVPPEVGEVAVQAVVKKAHFADQFTVMPHDGQILTVDGESLAWHAVDTPDYNVNLFHFAREYRLSSENVLFWAVTVINCPKEMPNVRLAIGSNSASVWWVNGEEVIGIYGDRQTVIDDGVSKRITLKQGPNVVRAAIINAGGATDFCARFLNENDKPLKGYTVTLSAGRS